MSEYNDFQYNLFLIGFMGAGKSTVAELLETTLHRERIEMDQRIVEEQKMTIPEIFEKYGEAYFRDLETELCRRFKQTSGVIVSCGGGAVMRDENATLMKESGKIVLLSATPETIYERVKDDNNRPLLQGNMNVEYIRELMEKRRARYESVADVTIMTDGKNAAEICQELLEVLKQMN